MIPKVMTGARAKVYIGKVGETPQLVGIFTNVSWGLAYDAQPAFILGAYAPREIDYTAQEPVNITASGWRIIGAGAHTAPKVPLLQELMKYEYLTFTIEDRATNTTILTVEYVRPLGYNMSIASRQLTEQSINFMGITASDEKNPHGFLEDGSASDLP